MNASAITRIVIVDDNDLMRTVLRGILRSDTYEVIGEARNGAVALDMIDRLRPEVVFLDVMMPEMDGLEALQAIKLAQPETIVIMVTGKPSVDNVQESIQHGAAGFIVKPFNAGKVLATLAQALASARRTVTS
ncbi:response regulator transcription factor [Rhodocyclus gracilis]